MKRAGKWQIYGLLARLNVLHVSKKARQIKKGSLYRRDSLARVMR